jgi:hypothetical protein
MFSRSIIEDSRSIIEDSRNLFDDSRVMLQLVVLFTIIICDHHIFIVQAIAVSNTHCISATYSPTVLVIFVLYCFDINGS